MSFPSESSSQKDPGSLKIIHNVSLKATVNPKSLSVYTPWLPCPTMGLICSGVGDQGDLLKSRSDHPSLVKQLWPPQLPVLMARACVAPVLGCWGCICARSAPDFSKSGADAPERLT